MVPYPQILIQPFGSLELTADNPARVQPGTSLCRRYHDICLVSSLPARHRSCVCGVMAITAYNLSSRIYARPTSTSAWLLRNAVNRERLEEALKSTTDVSIVLRLYVLRPSTTLMMISTFRANPRVPNPYSPLKEIAHFLRGLPDYSTRQPVYCECVLIVHLLKLDMLIQLHRLSKLGCGPRWVFLQST